MNKRFFLVLLLLAFLSPVCLSKDAEAISISSLLREMIDRDRLAEFPQPAYECKQASSYNRASVSPDKPGWFADSDGVSAIRVENINGRKEWVLMEDTGPGVITKIWAVCFYYGLHNTTGTNINFYLDGATEPAISANFFKLVKGQDFVKPPFAAESTRAGNLYFPIPYAKSCKITMDQKAFYNIINYRKYPPRTSVKTFTMEEFKNTAELQKEVAKVLNNKPNAKGKTANRQSQLKSGEQLTFSLPKGSGAVRQLAIHLSDTDDIAQSLRSVVLIGEFDGVQSVWTPVGDFFCNVGKVHPYDLWERSVKADGTMVCRWVMPYEKEGKITLKNLGKQAVTANLSVTTSPRHWTDNSMHFYASWRMDEPTPTFPLFDWNFLDASGRGVVVGDEWTVLNPRQGWWGEGDEKIYIDGDFEKNFPSHFGTGTEDYYGWAGGVVPTPADEFANLFVGNVIVGAPRSMGYNVCTRTRVLDAIPFKQRIKFDFESSCGTRQRWHYLQYAQTTFWYGRPGVKHNRPPLPNMASMDLPTLEGLQAVVEKAKKEQYIVDGALEAELLEFSKTGGNVIEDFAKIPMWGEVSSGGMKNIWFEKPGDYVEFKLTEQFETSQLFISAAVGGNSGNFDIYVNGQKKVAQDLYAIHPGITTPNVDLGQCDPVNNAFTIRFEFTGANQHAGANQGRYALGVDYFLIKNEFLER